MAVQNPYLDVLKAGATTGLSALSGASQSLGRATQAFGQGASLALKMDQLLQQEQANKMNQALRAQQIMQQGLNNALRIQLTGDMQRQRQDYLNRSLDIQEAKLDFAKVKEKGTAAKSSIEMAKAALTGIDDMLTNLETTDIYGNKTYTNQQLANKYLSMRDAIVKNLAGIPVSSNTLENTNGTIPASTSGDNIPTKLSERKKTVEVSNLSAP
jgi:hypothetical protein